MLRASRSVDLGGLAAIVFAGMVLAACASVFETSLPPETFKGDSAPSWSASVCWEAAPTSSYPARS